MINNLMKSGKLGLIIVRLKKFQFCFLTKKTRSYAAVLLIELFLHRYNQNCLIPTLLLIEQFTPLLIKVIAINNFMTSQRP